MAVVTMRQLLESGVHFGHQTRRWNPKMKRFILTERNGIYIIDLRQSLDYIEKAYDFVKNTVAEGGSVLFVGTKKQAQEAMSEQASRVGMPYVNHRWLGGMLTNFQTIHKRLQRMKELESIEQTGAAQGYTKKETLQLAREKDKLTRTLGGLRDMQKVPAAIWVVDTKKDLNAYAKVENQAGCCSPAMDRASACGSPAAAADTGCCAPAVSREVTEEEWIAATQGCCGAEPEESAVHTGLADLIARYDVNDYAASVQVYAIKP